MAVATAAAVLFLALFLLEILGLITNPYIGLVVFVAVPALFVMGLLLIPLGTWRARRRTGASSARIASCATALSSGKA